MKSGSVLLVAILACIQPHAERYLVPQGGTAPRLPVNNRCAAASGRPKHLEAFPEGLTVIGRHKLPTSSWDATY
jgi:hypothetical protein